MKLLLLATFAGGCFWCLQPPFDALKGVVSTKVGYMGGHTKNPTYDSVCSGSTGHAEVIQIEYNPKEVSYNTLLTLFWSNINPTQSDGQFVDKGTQYRSVIFYHTQDQQKQALLSKKNLEASLKQSVVTPIEAASTFYEAEDYHQAYYKKYPLRYQFYKKGSGRLK